MDFQSWYTREHYLDEKWVEARWYKHQMLRPGDMDSAVGYAFGIKTYGKVRDILGVAPYMGDSGVMTPIMPPPTHTVYQTGMLMMNGSRVPRKVLDVGAGRGEIACSFGLMGIPAIGLDKSLGSMKVFFETAEKWGVRSVGAEIAFLSLGFGDINGAGLTDVDTVIFCESLEHIPEDEFERGWSVMLPILRRNHGRLIVTNWYGNHPIEVDDTGVIHVRRVDDDLFDRLCLEGNVVYRESSHLVVGYG